MSEKRKINVESMFDVLKGSHGGSQCECSDCGQNDGANDADLKSQISEMRKIVAELTQNQDKLSGGAMSVDNPVDVGSFISRQLSIMKNSIDGILYKVYIDDIDPDELTDILESIRIQITRIQ